MAQNRHYVKQKDKILDYYTGLDQQEQKMDCHAWVQARNDGESGNANKTQMLTALAEP
jgi:hypothetical protein